MRTAAFLLASALSSVALAAPPAPVVTVHASGIKNLTFEWAPVAAATRYDLWFKANDNGPWTRYVSAPAPRSSFTIGVAVHLLHWPQARFQLQACDTSGCSTSNTVRVNDEKLVAMGYFKPDTPSNVFFYGGQFALSADGKTMAVLAGELVNGNFNTAVIYVYRRTISSWRRQARLVPNGAQAQTSWPFVGDRISLSGDGNLLVFGLWDENSSGPNPAESAGAVYLYRRSGSTWGLAQKLSSQNGRTGDNFGYVVRVDDAGRTLAITHWQEGAEPVRGSLEIFRDDPTDSSDQFMHHASVPVPRKGEIVGQCEAVALSGDGNSLLRACNFPEAGGPNVIVQALETVGFTETGRFTVRDFSVLEVSHDGTGALVNNLGEVSAYRRDSSGWVHDGILATAPTGGLTGHRDVAISRDGKVAAVGSPTDNAAGLGPIFEPYQTADTRSGGVMILERKTSGWVMRRLVKPGSTNIQQAGYTVALGDNARVLAVGAPLDTSAARGIDGNRHDDTVFNRGAVWLY
jgi:trimeric autotransporter adhesin